MVVDIGSFYVRHAFLCSQITFYFAIVSSTNQSIDRWICSIYCGVKMFLPWWIIFQEKSLNFAPVSHNFVLIPIFFLWTFFKVIVDYYCESVKYLRFKHFSGEIRCVNARMVPIFLDVRSSHPFWALIRYAFTNTIHGIGNVAISNR